MELKKIYLFASIASQYGVIDDFTIELANALNRQGVISQIIVAKRDDPRGFLDAILNDPPDCTLSFNGLLPDDQGRFLCDLIHIPHVACLTDAPHHYFPLIQSSLNIITGVDQQFCQTFKDLNFPQVIFLPHAASRTLKPLLENDLRYDVLMLNSFIDYEAIRQAWPIKYPAPLVKVLEEAAEHALAERGTSYLQAFIQAMDRYLRSSGALDPSQLDYPSLLDDLESYLGGKSRIELLQSIENASVHVFGSYPVGAGWNRYLKDQSNIEIHEAVLFTEALELMKRAKILLNCTPEIKYGAHERIFNGLLAGAAVLTLDTPYIAEHFEDEKDILLFSLKDKEQLNQKIHTYLQDEDARNRLVGKGRENVLAHHTWDRRAQTLIKELPPFLEKIKSHQEMS